MGVATGTFQYPNGSPVASGIYQWRLSTYAIALGSACISPQLFSGTLDANGNMTATFQFNDAITTAAGTNTTYQLTVKTPQGGEVWNQNYYLTGTAANINTVAPGSTSAGPFFYPVVVVDTISTVTASTLVNINGNSLIKCTGGSAGITVTASVGPVGTVGKFIKIDSGVGSVTIAATINGVAGYVLSNQYQYVCAESDGVTLFSIGNN